MLRKTPFFPRDTTFGLAAIVQLNGVHSSCPAGKLIATWRKKIHNPFKPFVCDGRCANCHLYFVDDCIDLLVWMFDAPLCAIEHPPKNFFPHILFALSFKYFLLEIAPPMCPEVFSGGGLCEFCGEVSVRHGIRF